jgi:hypothetical protein
MLAAGAPAPAASAKGFEAKAFDAWIAAAKADAAKAAQERLAAVKASEGKLAAPKDYDADFFELDPAKDADAARAKVNEPAAPNSRAGAEAAASETGSGPKAADEKDDE